MLLTQGILKLKPKRDLLTITSTPILGGSSSDTLADAAIRNFPGALTGSGEAVTLSILIGRSGSLPAQKKKD